ncbi:hypothetical protein BDZ97DRAFT_2063039 [Flammula alnicola]|nr:hypothetical protein BDZ97DRAFT_2063039 [Flammula alnicola]
MAGPDVFSCCQHLTRGISFTGRGMTGLGLEECIRDGKKARELRAYLATRRYIWAMAQWDGWQFFGQLWTIRSRPNLQGNVRSLRRSRGFLTSDAGKRRRKQEPRWGEDHDHLTNSCMHSLESGKVANYGIRTELPTKQMKPKLLSSFFFMPGLPLKLELDVTPLTLIESAWIGFAGTVMELDQGSRCKKHVSPNCQRTPDEWENGESAIYRMDITRVVSSSVIFTVTSQGLA